MKVSERVEAEIVKTKEEMENGFYPKESTFYKFLELKLSIKELQKVMAKELEKARVFKFIIKLFIKE